MCHSRPGVKEIAIPPDSAPHGQVTIPPMPSHASQIGG